MFAVDRGDVRLSVEVTGDGAPFVWAHPLLASMDADERAGVFDWSEAPCRLIRYDARSHGRSSYDPKAESHRWENLADDMMAVATAAEAPTAVLGGASMGAATALWAARQDPGRVRGLILVIPPTAWGSRPTQARLYRGLAMASAGRLLVPANLALRVPRPRPRRGTRAALADSILTSIGATESHHLAPPLRGSAESDLPAIAEVAALDVPTLILAWRGDRSHPISVARQLAGAMPRAELEIVGSDLSGWPELVADFLTRVDAQSPRARRR